MSSLTNIQELAKNDIEKQCMQLVDQNNLETVIVVDYSKRAQWLRAAVLGANDGLLSTSSLMMGIRAVHHDAKSMILTGIPGLVAGACSMAIREFVSVYSQYEIEVSQMKRENATELEGKKKNLPSPLKAASASAFAFAIGAIVPLFCEGLSSLLGFGGLGAYLGKAPLVKSTLRVLIGGCLAIGITFGLTKLVGVTGIYG
ncbi:unnamed protein product [Withania somnifera]